MTIKTSFPPDLPVSNHVEEILAMIRYNQVSILTGETGSGKSTGLAHMLFNAGYKVTRNTQPRITAATSVAEFVASTLDTQVGQHVGYMSSLLKETSANTKVTFITDGLQLAQEVHGHGIPDGEDSVIIIDEHHERSVNIDALVAVLLERIKNGAKFRLVFSSATADVERLQAWLTPILGGEIPHTHIKGRTFPIVDNLIHEDDVMDRVRTSVIEDKNILIVLPGVREVLHWCDMVESEDLGVEILPLYADLSKGDRDRVFKTDYGKPKVVIATNIAKTSITIPDLDVVIDFGLERRSTVDQCGVRGLIMGNTSKADCLQVQGRCGRTNHGEYYLVGMPMGKRKKFRKPDIHTSQLDNIVLQLAKGGFNPDKMEWIDAPPPAQIAASRKRLTMLGALSKNGKLSKIGEKMVTFPVDPTYARMLYEAIQRGVLADILVMVAVASMGKSIYDTSNDAFKAMRKAHDNDFFLQRDLFVDTQTELEINPKEDPEKWMEEQGIIPRRFYRALDLYNALCEQMGVTPFTSFATVNKEKDILASVFSGFWVYGVWQVEGQYAVDMTGNRRMLSRNGAAPEDGTLIVGTPFNLIEAADKKFYFLQQVSTVTDKVIKEVLANGWDDIPTPSQQAELQKPAKAKKAKKDRRNRHNRKAA